jgi:hypothetical protein
VQGAAAEDQIVPADTCSIGRHELDEPADTAEHPPARTTLPMTVRVFVPGTATNTMVPQNRNLWIQAQAHRTHSCQPPETVRAWVNRW